MKGIVKWFNQTKRYGFIEKEDGTGDIFIHLADVQLAGLSTLHPDDNVTFDIGKNDRGEKAINIQILK